MNDRPKPAPGPTVEDMLMAIFRLLVVIVIASITAAAFLFLALAAENPTEINPTLQAIDDPQDPTAQYILGHKYAYGRGKPRDYAKALKWFRRAADQGLILAQVRLAATHGNQTCGAGLRDNLETQMTAD